MGRLAVLSSLDVMSEEAAVSVVDESALVNPVSSVLRQSWPLVVLQTRWCPGLGGAVISVQCTFLVLVRYSWGGARHQQGGVSSSVHSTPSHIPSLQDAMTYHRREAKTIPVAASGTYLVLDGL